MPMIDIFCIGSPNISGDAVGPMVGSMLRKVKWDKDIKIIGCEEDPVTVSSYQRHLDSIRKGAFVVVVDAAVGDPVGKYIITEGPTIPGEALQRDFAPVGDLSIKGYTVSDVYSLNKVPRWEVLRLAYTIVIRLKNKDIYINKQLN